MSVIIAAFLTFVVTYVVHFYWRVSKYPKGPMPLPFIGNMLQFPMHDIHVFFDKLAETYGPCYTIWTPAPSIVITDYEHLKEAFVTQGDAFTYRSHLPPETLTHPHLGTGIGQSNGDHWKIQRRVALKILRDFGMGKNLMEQQVVRSMQEMFDQLKTMENKNGVDLFWPIQLCVGNVINETLFGFHYKYEDCDKFKKFVKIVNDHLKKFTGRPQMMIAAFPWLRHFPIIGELGYHSIQRNIVHYIKFIEEEVASQVKEYNPESEPENFVHAYMKQIDQAELPGLDMKNLCASVLDFWLAGMETTSTSLRWHLAYMMKYPEVQDKVRKEIIEAVGFSRLPSLSDKPKMMFTQAVIHEVQRHSNMVTAVGSHKNIHDVEMKGMKIPAGTNLFPQIWSIHRNDPVFHNSLEFNPDRYFNEDGKTFNKAVLEKTIPFSIGKRNCVGEGLARMELFVIFSALIQKYEFVPTSTIDLTPIPGMSIVVPPYTCRLVPQIA